MSSIRAAISHRERIFGGMAISFAGLQHDRGETGLVQRIRKAMWFEAQTRTGPEVFRYLHSQRVAVIELQSLLVGFHPEANAGARAEQFRGAFRIGVDRPVVIVAARYVELRMTMVDVFADAPCTAEIERRVVDAGEFASGHPRRPQGEVGIRCEPQLMIVDRGAMIA